jgi:hypothetical protein
MASEEERARILAEYMQEADKGEDEEEFQAEDYDEEENDNDSYGDDESHSDGDSQTGTGEPSTKKGDENYAVLSGNLIMNEEGRLVYSGTWCMKKDLEENQRIDEVERKKTKFKLKSKQNLKATGKVFDLANPLLGGAEKKARTVLFDGFFTTDKTDAVQPHRKVKERDVELNFSQGVPMKKGEKDELKKEACFVVKGKGSNDFGAFSLEGIYCPKSEGKVGVGGSHPLTCSKRYGFASGSKRGRDYDSEEDYEFSGDEDEAADMIELVGLADDNEMSVEELRKKYYGGTEEQQDEKEDTKTKPNEKEKESKAPAKRSKITDEDDDDGCGF